MRAWDLERELETLHRNYSESSVESELERALRDLEAHQKYVDAVRTQLARVRRTVMKAVPYLHRQHPYSSGSRVSYYIGVHWEPQVILDGFTRDEKPYCPSTDCERLEGGDTLKEAKEKVLALAGKHGVPLEGIQVDGFSGMVNPITGERPEKKRRAA